MKKSNYAPDFSALKDGEPHPSAHAAIQMIRGLGARDVIAWKEVLSSVALEGNRLAEVALGTLLRIIEGHPVSDRYVLGLAWVIFDHKKKKGPRISKNGPR